MNRREDLRERVRQQWLHLEHQTVALLNNLVHILKPATPDAPPAFPERVARLAFERGRTWDCMVVSWLRPAPAWVGLCHEPTRVPSPDSLRPLVSV